MYLVNMIFMGPFPQYNIFLSTCNILVLTTHAAIQPYSKKWLNILDTILLTDIVVLSMYSPVVIKNLNQVENIFYNYIIPYSLIIIPTVYLFGALGTILFKKVINQFVRKCFTNIFSRPTNPGSLRQSETKRQVSHTFVDPRKPLLELQDTEVPTQNSSKHEST